MSAFEEAHGVVDLGGAPVGTVAAVFLAWDDDEPGSLVAYIGHGRERVIPTRAHIATALRAVADGLDADAEEAGG